MISPNFAKDCMKSKEFGLPGGHIPPAPLRSATEIITTLFSHKKNLGQSRNNNKGGVYLRVHFSIFAIDVMLTLDVFKVVRFKVVS